MTGASQRLPVTTSLTKEERKRLLTERAANVRRIRTMEQRMKGKTAFAAGAAYRADIEVRRRRIAEIDALLVD